MLRHKTLFIVGAGASAEYGFPTGEKLKEKIASVVNPSAENHQVSFHDSEFNEAVLTSFPKTPEAYLHQNARLRIFLEEAVSYITNYSLSPSIDNYLELNKENECAVTLGKLGIARCIIDSERKSPLFSGDSNDRQHIQFSKSKDSWLNYLSIILNENINPSKVQDYFKNISFITFNYDRCIEQFFRFATESYFGKVISKEMISNLNIHHVYGSLGEYNGGAPSPYFGAPASRINVWNASRSIETFSETNLMEDRENKLQNMISGAHTIVFLGYGFNEINMKLIVPNDSAKIQRIYATSYEESESSRSVVKDILTRTYCKSEDSLASRRVSICVGSASDFFRNYGRELNYSRLLIRKPS